MTCIQEELARRQLMNIKVINEGNKTTVTLSGSIDIAGAESLKKTFNQIVESPTQEVDLDFHDVTFIGSSGIGKLLLFYKKFTAKGGKIRIARLNKEIAALFKAVKLDKLFHL